MISTPDLVDALVADATPVRRLRPPLKRAVLWLLLAAFILALLAVAQGVRADLLERLQQPAFVITMTASLLTGALAAIAAFMVSLPDRSRMWLLLPTPALVAWLSTLGVQCLTNWVSFDPAGIRLGETARCFATLVLTSLPLSLAMLVMLRHAALFRPTAVTLASSLAVAAITATALSLFHVFDATVMILVWNVGAGALIVALGGMLSRRMFSWVAPRSLLNQR